MAVNAPRGRARSTFIGSGSPDLRDRDRAERARARTVRPLGRGGRAAAWALSRLLGPRTAGLVAGRRRITVLAYHRIADLGDPGFRGDPAVVSATPEMFARQMDHVAREFDVIALDDLVAHVAGGAPLPPRPLLVTFDDGYRDNHEHALPVLRSRGLPAVVFLITGAIGTRRVMWWDELADMLERAPAGEHDLPPVGRRLLAGPASRAAARFELLAALKEVEDAALREGMRRLREALAVPAAEADPPLFMGWNEVAELTEAGISCQPHTHDHPLLTRVDRARAREEIVRSAAEVERRTGRPASAFAYPNGSHDPGVVRILAEAGIAVAFTMRPGPVRASDARAAPLEVPRVSLDARDTFDLFRLKVSGGLTGLLGARDAIRGRRSG